MADRKLIGRMVFDVFSEVEDPDAENFEPQLGADVQLQPDEQALLALGLATVARTSAIVVRHVVESGDLDNLVEQAEDHERGTDEVDEVPDE